MKKKSEYTGFPGDCSPEQLETLARFRVEVQNMGINDPTYDDAYLLRFLRARKFDLPKTLEMWRNFIKWRHENNVDNILSMDFSEMDQAKKYYPHGYFRTDKSGRPIYIERIGYLKFDALTKIISMDRMQLYFVQSYERLLKEIFPACTKAAGKRVDQTCYIIDLKDAGAKLFSSSMREIIKLASKIGQDYYPEVLGNMFIINTPMVFHGIWGLIKPFIDEKTKKKIHILGSKYRKELSEFISDENLPDFLGGQVTSKDYGENFAAEQGPWVNPISDIHASSQVPIRQESIEKPAVQRNEEIRKPVIIVQEATNHDLYDIRAAPENEEVKREQVVITHFEKSSEIRIDSTWDTLEVAQEMAIRSIHIREFRTRPSFSIDILN